MQELNCDVLVIGGGLGGVAAALAAVRMGRQVVLTEETDWLGGQLTSQAVPPDEHPWIEQFGCTATYRRLRDAIRSYYRRTYPLTEPARATEYLNPGQGVVSRLCHEPRVAVAAIDELLAPHRSSGRLQVLLRHRPVAAATEGDRVTAVRLLDTATGRELTASAPYILDATEDGELLELAGVEHVTGSESRADTGEPHALDGPAQPLDQQSFTYCFALDHRPGENHTIDRPRMYGFWRDYAPDFWPAPLLSWSQVSPEKLFRYEKNVFEPDRDFDLWRFRRILHGPHLVEGDASRDITLVNWQQVDYWLGPVIGVDAAERERHLDAAKQLSLSFLYWMQTEAPTHDGGTGYPGLRLRPDVVDTADGLAKYPYLRESRRIRAEFTVTEQHVGVAARGELQGAEEFRDSVGIGSYRIDLHPSTGSGAGPRQYIDVESWPFQIPLGALLPVRVENLLPAAKNIGTTHITNGCYRLHPVEWNIGEAAGALAAYCLETGSAPRQVHADPVKLDEYQKLLTDLGVELGWPREVRTQKKYN
ncbi:FAD-dependent oxidoreductase [Streptomyces sp. N35]|uniref:FAD-dependent oxidoreductase n=1 Tax=Streptomyces sp. N35 TaxID=2795730 RepID=UPI0018F32399|nr:FAD-dependent oxidoreductase [Streptomyces sp. N35]